MYPPNEWLNRFAARKRARSKVEFTKTGIQFRNYDFLAASVYPNGLLPYSQIENVYLTGAPPEVHTRTGETLFVWAYLRNELEATAKKNSIPIVRPLFDVWSNILEPFLDKELTDADERRILKQLARAGLSESEVMQIRERVGAPMAALSLVLWDGWYFGLCHLLDMMQAAMEPDEYRELYAEAMRIAQLNYAGNGRSL